MIAYFPNVQVPAQHKMVVHMTAAFLTDPTTYIKVYVGMTDEQFHRSSGAQRENCKEMFAVDPLANGRYQLRHIESTTCLHGRGKKVRTVTTTAAKVDEVLQRFLASVNSTLEQV